MMESGQVRIDKEKKKKKKKRCMYYLGKEKEKGKEREESVVKENRDTRRRNSLGSAQKRREDTIRELFFNPQTPSHHAMVLKISSHRLAPGCSSALNSMRSMTSRTAALHLGSIVAAVTKSCSASLWLPCCIRIRPS